MKERFIFIFTLLFFLPKIIFRYLKAIFVKKNFVFNEFRPTNSICIESSLNQLVWNVENCIFLTVSNSSKIYFKSGEFIFKCNGNKTSFTLKVFTINGVKTYKTSIKVIKLKQKELNMIVSQNEASLNQNLNIKIVPSVNNLNSIINKRLELKIKNNTVKSDFNKIKMFYNDKDIIFLINNICNTETIKELELLKEKI